MASNQVEIAPANPLFSSGDQSSAFFVTGANFCFLLDPMVLSSRWFTPHINCSIGGLPPSCSSRLSGNRNRHKTPQHRGRILDPENPHESVTGHKQSTTQGSPQKQPLATKEHRAQVRRISIQKKKAPKCVLISEQTNVQLQVPLQNNLTRKPTQQGLDSKL